MSGYPTTFRSQTNDIRFHGTNADEVPADPSGHTNIGRYIVAENTTDGAEASFLINVSYTDAEASGVNEDDLLSGSTALRLESGRKYRAAQ